MEQKRPYFRRTPAAEEEEKVWVSFYRNASDPHLAAELIAHMDRDADSRMQYPGLYLRCKQSVRRNREREARAKRIASALRMVLRLIVLAPSSGVVTILRKMRAVVRFSGNVVLNVCDGGAPAARPLGTPVAKQASMASTSSAATSPFADDMQSTTAAADIAKSA
jgi:hypothetical protein